MTTEQTLVDGAFDALGTIPGATVYAYQEPAVPPGDEYLVAFVDGVESAYRLVTTTVAVVTFRFKVRVWARAEAPGDARTKLAAYGPGGAKSVKSALERSPGISRALVTKSEAMKQDKKGNWWRRDFVMDAEGTAAVGEEEDGSLAGVAMTVYAVYLAEGAEAGGQEMVPLARPSMGAAAGEVAWTDVMEFPGLGLLGVEVHGTGWIRTGEAAEFAWGFQGEGAYVGPRWVWQSRPHWGWLVNIDSAVEQGYGTEGWLTFAAVRGTAGTPAAGYGAPMVVFRLLRNTPVEGRHKLQCGLTASIPDGILARDFTALLGGLYLVRPLAVRF